MENFYERWLKFWDEAESQRAKARKVIYEEELEWIQTEEPHLRPVDRHDRNVTVRLISDVRHLAPPP